MQSIASESKELKTKLLGIKPSQYQQLALQIFRFQARNCDTYHTYIESLGVEFDKINRLEDVPYLPVSAFKNEKVITGKWDESEVFHSSTTTGGIPACHYVKDANWYKIIARKCFEDVYGPVSDYSFFCLLPNYLERKGSSLVFMADDFIKTSGRKGGFYLYDHKRLIADLRETRGKKILLGVSYALLDIVKELPGRLDDIIVMETGGMKGRKEEIPRGELHLLLEESFGVNEIHSEYGMTELMSQAYSKGKGVFHPSFSMKISTVQVNDPLTIEEYGRTGIIRIIDLANIDSCSFVMTNDLGNVYVDGSFEIMGRADHSEIRGCNLMVSDL